MKNAIFLIVLCVIVLLVFPSCPSPGGSIEYQVTALVADNAPTLGDIALISIYDADSNPIVDAIVTVNGTNVPSVGFGIYSLVGGPYTPGQNITLVVQKDGVNINQTKSIPTQPVVSAPAAGTYNAANNLTVTWQNYNPDPSSFNIFVNFGYTSSGDDYDETVAGSIFSHIIPGGTLAAAQNGVTVKVTAMSAALLGGTGVQSGSSFTTTSTGSSAAFNTN